MNDVYFNVRIKYILKKNFHTAGVNQVIRL